MQFPQAVTLPYNYVQLPTLALRPKIPDLDPVIPPSPGMDSNARQQKIEEAKQKFEAWQQGIKDRKIREARKLAPGFLDTGVTMLTPTIATTADQRNITADRGAEEESKKDDYLDQFASIRF